MTKDKIIKYVLTAICIILFGIFIYPGLYQYDKLDQKYPVKINRLTGQAKAMIGTNWKVIDNPEDSKPDLVALLKEELAKDREKLKKDMIAEAKKQISSEVTTDVKNELDSVKKEITAYKKFETDPSNYFSIGSTKDEVKSIMGTPTGTFKYIFGDEETWHYGNSDVHFKNGKVIEYSNVARNLRIK